ncbi:MAG TPA: PRD domain-containing protein [Candidatus Mediterraneibacter vanvlietii]|nr:PRD domain-containing protein [Candidatus Mediterraneibacter vanvlietii]
MRIEQVLNNNVVIASEEDGRKIIIDARGIGFNNKPGSVICEEDYPNMRKYVQESEEYQKLRDFYENTDQKLIDISKDLLNREAMEKKIDHPIPVSAVMLLADHLEDTVSRLKNGLYLRNALTNEIKAFYSVEFELSKSIGKTMLETYEVAFNDDEFAFVSIHLINLNANNMNETMMSIQIVDELVDIVRRVMNLELKLNTYVYSRFITHLKYFAERVITRSDITSRYDAELDAFLKNNYKRAYSCALTIKKFVLRKYRYEITDDEVIYLTLHLEGLKRENAGEQEENI